MLLNIVHLERFKKKNGHNIILGMTKISEQLQKKPQLVTNKIQLHKVANIYMGYIFAFFFLLMLCFHYFVKHYKKFFHVFGEHLIYFNNVCSNQHLAFYERLLAPTLGIKCLSLLQPHDLLVFKPTLGIKCLSLLQPHDLLVFKLMIM